MPGLGNSLVRLDVVAARAHQASRVLFALGALDGAALEARMVPRSRRRDVDRHLVLLLVVSTSAATAKRSRDSAEAKATTRPS